MEQRTTDLKRIKNIFRHVGYPVEFTWGTIIELHEVGEYTIAEYHPWKSDNGKILMGEPDGKKTEFHGWVSGEDTSHSWLSLDDALAGLISYKYEGHNGQAGYYFMKMVKPREK
jgi:hypothetical protein